MRAPAAIASEASRRTRSIAACQRRRPAVHFVQSGEDGAGEAGQVAVVVDVDQLGQLVVVDHRVRQLRCAGRTPGRGRAGSAPGP